MIFDRPAVMQNLQQTEESLPEYAAFVSRRRRHEANISSAGRFGNLKKCESERRRKISVIRKIVSIRRAPHLQ